MQTVFFIKMLIFLSLLQQKECNVSKIEIYYSNFQALTSVRTDCAFLEKKSKSLKKITIVNKQDILFFIDELSKCKKNKQVDIALDARAIVYLHYNNKKNDKYCLGTYFIEINGKVFNLTDSYKFIFPIY